MASLLRVAVGRGARLLAANSTTKTKFLQPTCLISTSKKNKDSASLTETNQAPITDERLDEKEENWISYGWSITDQESDRFHYNLFNFFGMTVGIIGLGFIFAYAPDFNNRDWQQREAFMELARRQREGLPLVDRELIPVENINLPSEAELGDFEIVV